MKRVRVERFVVQSGIACGPDPPMYLTVSLQPIMDTGSWASTNRKMIV